MIESDIASDSKTDINRPSPQSSALEVEVLNKLMQESKSVLLERRCVSNLAAEDRYSSLYSSRVSVENKILMWH